MTNIVRLYLEGGVVCAGGVIVVLIILSALQGHGVFKVTVGLFGTDKFFG